MGGARRRQEGGALGVVTRRHQQVGEHQQLVVGEALPVLLPVVVVGAPELGQRLFHRHLEEKHNRQPVRRSSASAVGRGNYDYTTTVKYDDKRLEFSVAIDLGSRAAGRGTGKAGGRTG